MRAQGLEHAFHVTGAESEARGAYSRFADHDADAIVDDEILQRFAWTLIDVPSWNPARREESRGLHFNGPTILRPEGARALGALVRAWTDLVRVGPRWIMLNCWSERDDDGEEHVVFISCARRETTIASLERLAAVLDRVVEPDQRVLHMGT